MTNVLTIRELYLSFVTRIGVYNALNGVDLDVKEGEVLGVAGESGSGKSTLALTIAGVLPPNAWIKKGEVRFKDIDLVRELREVGDKGFNKKRNQRAFKELDNRLQAFRGSKIAIVFQDPMTSLNPVLQIGYQIGETIYYHNPALLAKRILARSKVTKDELREIIRLLEQNKETYVEKLNEFVKSKGLEGLEDQILFIWERNDIYKAKKQKLILSLEGEKLSGFVRNFLENVAETNRVRNISRIPIISRRLKSTLIKEGYRKAVEILTMLNVPNPEKVVYMYPHELSGGMRQRVAIAIAIVNNPELIIMDEPTSALDVTVQAQVLELVRSLKKKYNSTFIFISHDLSVLYEISDRIAVMYAGRVVEVGNVEDVVTNPLHPYTQSLLRAVPTIDSQEVSPIPGEVPDMRTPPSGCMFHPRCPFVMEKCKNSVPLMYQVRNGHKVACFLYGGDNK
ncbi:ABC transporter [Sulfolobus acidocaldarius SUSAZ]|nr:ABC transporter [Sulfolobus acidocaldarius SUSAZ]